MGFTRQESWSELPFPSPGDLPNPGIKPGAPAFQAGSLPLSNQRSPEKKGIRTQISFTPLRILTSVHRPLLGSRLWAQSLTSTSYFIFRRKWSHCSSAQCTGAESEASDGSLSRVCRWWMSEHIIKPQSPTFPPFCLPAHNKNRNWLYWKTTTCLPVLVWADRINEHRLGSLNKRHLVLTFPEARKSKIKMLADMESANLWMATFSFGEGNGNPLQYSCLENPMDWGTWQAIVRGVAKSQTWLKRLNTHLLIGVLNLCSNCGAKEDSW